MQARDTFDHVAELYDALRPGYPAALFTDLSTTAGLAPADRVLEIGCGSGQATQGLADLAGPVLALDPGAELIRLARRRLADQPQVSFAVSSFEAFVSEPHAFKLACAAQAWHWIDPGLAFPRAAQALAPGGWLAIFGHIPMPPASPLLEDFQAVYDRVVPGVWGPTPESWYLPTGPVAGLIEASGLFGPVVHHGYAFTRTHTAQSFGDLFGTISHYNTLAPDRRAALLAGLQDVIVAHGGRYAMAYETHLYMAPVKG
jgi:SAM-dependent methyltransferase